VTNISKKSQSNVATTANTQMKKVVWTEKMIEDYLDICITEIHAGNRLGTYFNKIGWKNVIDKFNEKAGKQYCYKQLKNKFDSLKKEWNIWKRLIGKETGFGWDPVKKTIDAPNDWWEKKLQVLYLYLFVFV
jgi:hypothetical protein